MKKNTNQNSKVKVVKGSHLTVTTYPDGKVNLEWDWNALTNEVVIATGLVKVTEVKVSKTRSKKK